MPIKISDVDDSRGNIIKAWGVLTGKEVIEAFGEHAGQDIEKFMAYRYSLADYTEVTRTSISLREIRNIHNLITGMARINQVAIVASAMRDGTIYRITRIMERVGLMKVWKHTTFRSDEEARKWIEQEVKSRHGISDIRWKVIEKRPNKAL